MNNHKHFYGVPYIIVFYYLKVTLKYGEKNYFPTTSSSWSSSVCSAQGRSFTANAGTKAAVLPTAGLLPPTQEPGLQFYQGWIGAIVSRCFPHPTLSLASEQTLKDLKDPRAINVEVRGVNLANWDLRTSPKFTRGVKYQFHQGFWVDHRSGNHNH